MYYGAFAKLYVFIIPTSWCLGPLSQVEFEGTACSAYLLS